MKKKNDENIWKRILKMYLNYKKFFAMIALCLVGSSLITFFQPLVIQQITDRGMTEKNISVIFQFAGILLLLGLSAQILQLLLTRSITNFHNTVSLELEQTVFEKMLHLPISYFKEKNATEINSTMSSDISTVASLAERTSTYSISSILQIVGGVTGLILLNWKMTFVILGFIPIRYLIIFFISKKKSSNFQEYIENSRIVSSWMGDQIDGIRELKLWNMLGCNRTKYRRMQQRVFQSHKKNVMLDQFNMFVENMIDTVINCILYSISGYLILQDQFTIGSAFAFITYSSFVITPMNYLINMRYLFADIKPSAERLFLFLDSDEESKFFSEKVKEKKEKEDSVVLRCKNIIFGYESNNIILMELNLDVHKGEKIGIIGDNGSGKSTLLDLILGFYIPLSGEIYYQGQNYTELDINKIRDKFAVVSQAIHVFNTTIEDNVNLAGTAGNKEVKAACHKSGADEFIHKFPQKYNHYMGTNGSNLSGGEKQKIAVARAILKHSEILIFDEATNGFDIHSVKYWNEILEKEFVDQTVIMVTHKLEELVNMDRIFQLKEGKLKEV